MVGYRGKGTRNVRVKGLKKKVIFLKIEFSLKVPWLSDIASMEGLCCRG